MATRNPRQLTLTQTAAGGFRFRCYLGGFGNSSIDWDLELTVAQMKAVLDVVGVAGSAGAGTAGVETVIAGNMYSGGEIPANLAA